MLTDDYGKDLAAVQTLQRKQDEVERDMTALHSQLGVSVELKAQHINLWPLACQSVIINQGRTIHIKIYCPLFSYLTSLVTIISFKGSYI